MQNLGITLTLIVLELESSREKQEIIMASLKYDHEDLKIKAQQVKFEADRIHRTMEIEIDDIKRKHNYEVDDMRENYRKEVERLTRAAANDDENMRKEARDELDQLRRSHEDEVSALIKRQKFELEEERQIRIQAVEEISRQRDLQIDKIASTIGNKEREADVVRDELQRKIAEIDQQRLEVERERVLRQGVEAQLQQKLLEISTLNSANQAVKAQVEYLESDNQQQSSAFATLHKQTQDAIAARDEAIEKLRAEETLRRKLHNQVQELKGNIRVFCRVRPLLDEPLDEAAKLRYPDEAEESKEVVVFGAEQKSSLGTVSRPQHGFEFDRVFGPASNNGEIFDEISQLIQSALDGYNVCIFCYGQTGSGKTHTMSSTDGMIPRAVRQIYGWAKDLEEKGWKYKMEGSFVEVYNENLNDLLGKAEEFDKKKHEIRHDTEKMKTTITGVQVVPLDSPEAVEGILNQADRNRSVAATKANQRSSRSHSVFILTLVGENEVTGERSEGTLNLVDLAGSERLSHSQAEGQRLKETQNINKSLSCLGDVIGALGRGDSGHIPYRNSKVSQLRWQWQPVTYRFLVDISPTILTWW
jgi:kinesin family protein C1